MKEIAIQVRIFNNRLRERRLDLGLTSAALCRQAKVSPWEYGKLEGLKCSPRRAHDEQWRLIATRLACFYGVPEEELFPGSLGSIATTVVEKRISAEQAFSAIEGAERLALPADKQMENIERERELSSMLATLTKYERRTIEGRFGLDGHTHAGVLGATLEDLAAEFGVSRERVRQIEAKALRKLRSTHCTAKMTELMRDG